MIMGISRRHFLQWGVTGLGSVALGTSAHAQLRPRDPRLQPPPPPPEPDPNYPLLTMREALVQMVDETEVYMWLFDDGTAPRFPGPVLYVTEGDAVRLQVRNELPIGTHGFAIPGVVDSGVIQQGQFVTLDFTAPPAGTYLYVDPLQEPMNRALGLHGVLVSTPAGAAATPYSNPTLPVQTLFEHLGQEEYGFPGHPWSPEKKTVIWVFHQVDPALNHLVRLGHLTNPDQFAQLFQPRYFTINGRSGYFAHHAHDTHLHSTVGHPHLIRNVNTGLWIHSPHTHANHCHLLALNGVVRPNVFLMDTWTIRPMWRMDLLFPFIVPPDIPEHTWEKVKAGTQEEPFPMHYPMHCHMEVAVTAAGGNYPQGLVTGIEILGPVDQIAAPGNPPPGYPWPLNGGHQH
jgi:FtsP/CotA-like multicopper oxidase with cupredoxin domain